MIKIDLYGDSTQVGNEPLPGGGYAITLRPPSVILQEMMDDEFGVGAVIVRNKGIGSTYLANFWQGLTPYTRSFDAEMDASDAHIVITNHGINDAYANGTAAHYIAYVNAMAASCAARGKKFFIETMNPMTTAPAALGASYTKALYTTPINDDARIIDVYRLVKNNMDYWTIDGLRDGFHPSEELYSYIGRVLFTGLETCVKNLIDNPPPPAPVLEDLTTYAEIDQSNNFVVTPNTLTFNSLSRAVSSCLSKPFTVTGSFKIDFEYTMTSNPNGGVNPHAWMMLLSNSVNDQVVLPNQGAGYAQGILIGRGASPMVQLFENVNGTIYQSAIQPITLNYKFFATIEKNVTAGANGTLYLKLYTNSQRTNLTASLTLALHSQQSFGYLSVLQSLNSGHAAAFSGIIANLRIY